MQDERKKKRAFSWASILLVLMAIGLHLGSMAFVGQAHKLRFIVLRGPEDEKELAQKEIDRCYVWASIFGFTGLGMAIGSIVCAIISYFRDEKTLFFTTIALLIFYLFMQFLII